MITQSERTRLIVDMSSVLWTCLLAGKDTEFGREVWWRKEGEDEDKKFHVNGAAYGYENTINHFVALLNKFELAPMDMVLVVEGMSSKLMRQNVLPLYKGKKDRPEDAYIEFNKLKEMVLEKLLALGAIAVTQDGIEADDVIGYLCHKLPGRKIVDSNDGDICALISDGSTGTSGVSVWKQSKGLEFTENPYGPFPCKHVTTYKAIVGDTGDKIPGAKGFGDKKWLDMLCNMEDDSELDMLLTLILEKRIPELQEDVAYFKDFSIIIREAEMVYKSYRCARLYPDMVNTTRKPLVFTPGMVKPSYEMEDSRLKHWAGQVRLVHAGNFKQATDWMKIHLEESPFISFDIETSSNDTADQWLETAKTKSSESKDAENIDVFGAELCSFALTFGRNMQYTLFFTVDHVETPKCKNLTKVQAKQVLEMLPKSKRKAIQNMAFELPVVMENLGALEEVE